MSDARTPMGDVKKETVSTERLREMLAAIPRYANGNVRSAAWVGRVPAPTLEAILTELLALRQPDTRMEGGGAKVRPLDTAPSGEDAMEPSEIDVHEGSWALIIGTNGKPAGWIDTHALFAHQLYCDQILAAPSSPTVGELEAGFADWWNDDGRFLDPDTSDVPWFDKREALAQYAYDAALSSAQSSIQRAERERDGYKAAIDAIADFDVDGPLSPETVQLIRIAGATRRASLGEKQDAE